MIVSARRPQAPTRDERRLRRRPRRRPRRGRSRSPTSSPSTAATANIVVVNAIVTPKMRAENPDKAYKTFTDASEIAEAIAFLLGRRARR